MIQVNTIPSDTLNVSKLVIQLNGAQMWGLQFSLTGFGKYTDGETGEEKFGNNPVVSDLLTVNGDTWRDWTPDAANSDDEYIASLALKQLGLTRDESEPIEPVEIIQAVEADSNTESETE